MIFWYGVVGVLLLVFLAQFVHYLHVQHLRNKKVHHHLLTHLTEHDMLYMPGDQAFDDECDEDYMC